MQAAAKGPPSPNRLLQNPFVWGLSLALIFYAALHPLSWMPGGMVFFFFGWIIPDLVNLSIAFGIAWWLEGKGLVKQAVVFVPAAVLLAALPSLPDLIEYARCRPVVGYQVNSPVTIQQGQFVEVGPFDFPIQGDPFAPKVAVGGNEGCMCLYFKRNDANSYLRMLSLQIGEKAGSARYLRVYSGGLPDLKGLHFTMAAVKASANTYDFRLNVFADGREAGSFWQKGLPASTIYRGKGGLWPNFWANATEILLKNTYLAEWLSRASGWSYYPRAEIGRFLDQLLVPDGSAKSVAMAQRCDSTANN